MLLVSFIDETRVFRFDQEGDVEELDGFRGFSLTERTLVSCNVVDGKLLQVTPSGARLVDSESGTVISAMSLDIGRRINMASANADTLIYVIDGSSVFVADLRSGFKQTGERSFDNEIACLTIPPAPCRVCVIGQWTASVVSILALPTLETLAEETLAGTENVAVPRSLLLANILEGQSPTLLVAMGDGTLFTFAVDETNCLLTQKKSIVLGTQSVYLQPIPRPDGLVHVFATCDHPSLIYGSEGRIAYSTVTADKATHVTSFNAQGYPHAVVVASEEDLKLAIVDPQRATHVRTLPIGDVVRRVAHSKERQVFGVLTINLQIDKASGDEQFQCYVRIVDEVMFGLIDSFKLQETELVESIMCAELGNGDGTFSERFVVGTGFQDENRDESTKGRIIVFELSEDKRLRISSELSVRGTCKGLDMVEGKIVAALNKTVSWTQLSIFTRVKADARHRRSRYIPGSTQRNLKLSRLRVAARTANRSISEYAAIS